MERIIDDRAGHELAGLFRSVNMAAIREGVALRSQLRGGRSFQIEMTTLRHRLDPDLLQIERLEIIRVDQQPVGEPQRKEQRDFCLPKHQL